MTGSAGWRTASQGRQRGMRAVRQSGWRFIGALQRLPGRQRAVLVLRDVLGFHAAETAAMLETSVDGVKSALKRARATIEQEIGDQTERIAPPPPTSVEEQELVEQFARAFLADDIDGMVALVTQNAWFRMPPACQEYHGPELIGAFLAAVSEGHWSGATSSGYRAIELWDSPEDCQAFAEGHFAPKLPPGAELPPMEFFELNFEVKPAP
jgi:hypothetical protein